MRLNLVNFYFWVIACCVLPNLATAEIIADSRQLYSQASAALKADNLDKYYQIKTKLTHYPLYPYLEQQEFEHDFEKVTQQQIDRYAEQYNEIPSVSILQKNWLRYLASKKHWKQYITAYESSPNSGELYQCHYRNALLETAQPKRAFKDINDLWNAGHSISRACDYVFNYWITKSQGPQSALAYQRFWRATETNNIALARYLQRFIKTKKEQQATNRFFQVSKDLSLLKNPGFMTGDALSSRKTYLYGLDKLSRKDPLLAANLWVNVRTKLSFSFEEQQKLNRNIARRLASKSNETTDSLLGQLNMFADEYIHNLRFKLALTEQNWQKVHRLIDQLSPEEQTQERWVYWKTISASHIKGLKPAYSDAFENLSKERSYYGLLASRTLQTRFHLNPQQDKVSESLLEEVSSNPAVARMHELYQLNNLYLARREWNQFTRGFDKAQLRTAATVLHRWGWHNMAIAGVAKAKFWDDISLRFPMPYSTTFDKLAGQFNIDTNWARAVARQESAYQPYARSRVGARGLMQLMPKTARSTAKRNDINYKNIAELYQPETNINLGVAYLAEMQEKFNGNQVLATAAYNAGPHRVKKWLKQRGNLPTDIWIEVIPFKETRNYVMNVMAYHAVYRTLAGQPSHVIEDQSAFRVALTEATSAQQAERLRQFVQTNNNATQTQ
ncbi:transglycosylase SLT domain-containing protein [Amphritea japonica]|uniref:Soluble lytic murein transglycosylase n=1 Tax=Amphritea japonica ATCC BAA-1530 TaxID=1278309 RepID=A0A7R6PH75_9GAMM|nr:transglycosylase SLT domain-containing protein [Amphritea japonica]BBB26427.1 soluble lytic murein transglycosylase [Amphritea japonica ATCC BAA-1530]